MNFGQEAVLIYSLPIWLVLLALVGTFFHRRMIHRFDIKQESRVDERAPMLPGAASWAGRPQLGGD